MKDIEGFILVGGRSSRMGEDKSRLWLGGVSLVGRGVASVSTIVRRVRVVGSRPGLEAHALPVVRDVYEGLGPLAGLHAALAACEEPWAAVIACDLPFVPPKLFERLASLRGEDVDAVAPLQEDGRPQPLCALYAAARCRDEADRLLRAGELRPRALLKAVRTRWVQFDELSDLEGSRHFFDNVNTPADYERAVNRDRSVNRKP